MDYSFLIQVRGVREDEDTASPFGGKRKMQILVVYDYVKGAFWTLELTAKGPTEVVVKWCCNKLEDSGCARS